MGNYRFRLSDMIPNAWFYKLKDMSKLNKNHHYKNPTNTLKKLQAQAQSSSSPLSLVRPPPDPNPNSQITKLPLLSDQRKSYYFTRDSHNFKIRAELPRKSSRSRRSPKRSRQPHSRQPAQVSSTISAVCSCPTKLESVWTKKSDQTISLSDENGSDRGLTPDDAFADVLASCKKCQTRNDVVIDDRPIIINGHYSDFDHHDLPPIITKKQAHQKPKKFEHGKTSPGVKLRTNTPKIANRRINYQGRRSTTAESFAVVKTSKDPGRDFRESMVEMIVENNIRASKDLEELLACYLSLNSYEYHGLIINVFKQIWFDFIRLRPN